MAFAFRFTSERLYELGFLNRLVDADEAHVDGARDGGAPADAAAGLPRQHADDDARDAATRAGRARALADRLHDHGAKTTSWSPAAPSRRSARRTSRAGTTPSDRYRTPKLQSVKK